MAVVDPNRQFDNFIKGIVQIAKYMSNDQIPITAVQEEAAKVPVDDIVNLKCECGGSLNGNLTRVYYQKARVTKTYGTLLCSVCNKPFKYRSMK